MDLTQRSIDWYETNTGDKVQVFRTGANVSHPNIGVVTKQDGSQEIIFLSNDGKSEIRKKGDVQISLFSELKQTIEDIEFDPTCLPKWANRYIFLNEQGRWIATNVEANPEKYRGTVGTFVTIPREYQPKNFVGNWQNSLIELTTLDEF